MISYKAYLAEIDAGRLANPPAPKIAIDYWKLPATATLRDVVEKVRNDEAGHRDKNHEFADRLEKGLHPIAGGNVVAEKA